MGRGRGGRGDGARDPVRGPRCRMSILRNGHVPRPYFFCCNFHVDLKMVPYLT